MAILAVAAILLASSGCSQNAAPGGNSGAGAPGGKIGSPDRANQQYYWISQASNLPLFVERVYPALKAFERDYGVKVTIAGPTTVDLQSYVATVEQITATNPAGMIVVGGWDPALTEPVNKAIAAHVPVVVTDGDLFDSNRLAYVGTDWYNVGVKMAQVQIAEHKARGLTSGKIAVIAPVQNENMQHTRQAIKDTLQGTGIEVVAEEDNESQADIAAQKTSALLNSYQDLTGIAGLDSEAGPGIVAALKESQMAGKIIVTCNENGREFLQNLKDGTISMITMERYDVMDYLALQLLYDWHNDSLGVTGLDIWANNWMPHTIDSGLLLVTKDNVDEINTWLTNLEASSGASGK